MIVVFYALTLNLLIFLDCYAISVCQKLTSLTEVNSVCKSFTMNWLGINKKHCYTRVVWYSTGLDCPSKFRSHCTEKNQFTAQKIGQWFHIWNSIWPEAPKRLLARMVRSLSKLEEILFVQTSCYRIHNNNHRKSKLLCKDMAGFPIVPMRNKWSNVKSVFAFTWC